MRRRFFGVVVVMTVVLGVVGLSSATAKNPGQKKFVVDEIHDEFGPFPIFGCKDGAPHEGEGAEFMVELSGTFNLVHTHQPVGNGDTVKHQTWVDGRDTFANSEDPSKVASGKFGNTDVGHLTGLEGEEEGIIRIHGTSFHVVAPGSGVVIKDVGIITLDLSLLPGDPFVSFKGVSNFDPGPGGDTDPALCAALS